MRYRTSIMGADGWWHEEHDTFLDAWTRLIEYVKIAIDDNSEYADRMWPIMNRAPRQAVRQYFYDGSAFMLERRARDGTWTIIEDS